MDAFVANSELSGPNPIWFNDGAGTFVMGQSLGSSVRADVALEDLDGDGDLDAFVANWWGQGNKIWANDGMGFFSDS